MIRTPELYQATTRTSAMHSGSLRKSATVAHVFSATSTFNVDSFANAITAFSWLVKCGDVSNKGTASSWTWLRPAFNPWDWWWATSYRDFVRWPTVRIASSRSRGLRGEL